jgi:hypothetical protein
MTSEALYSAAIAGAPFLLLTLLSGTRVLGPGPFGRHRRNRRGELTLDLLVVGSLALSFFLSLYALAAEGPTDVRKPVAYGLMLGGIGVFLHGLDQVLRLYRRPVD